MVGTCAQVCYGRRAPRYKRNALSHSSQGQARTSVVWRGQSPSGDAVRAHRDSPFIHFIVEGGRMSKRSLSACISALLSAPIAAGMSTAAIAQDAPASSAVTGIEEVVVTARKREENLQDIPLSVTAI